MSSRWLADPDGVDREVLVLEEGAEILGVVVHEDDDGDRFINALAIRADRQGEGLGRLVLRSVLDDLSERFPGRVATWLVAPADFASHAMSEAAGAEAISARDQALRALHHRLLNSPRLRRRARRPSFALITFNSLGAWFR